MGKLMAWLVMLCVACGATHISLDRDTRMHITDVMGNARFPSSAVAVVESEGTAFVLNNTTADTLFQIGSLSKAFTGLGVLMLEETGLLSVMDPVSQHLPWFPSADMTIFSLLHHTNVMTNDERHFPSATLQTTDEFIQQMANVELTPTSRGASLTPSNANYIALGILIEEVSGQSFDEFMTQHILHPLGLYDTFTCVGTAHATGRVAGGHRLGFFGARAWNPPASPIAVPALFMYSSIIDMARWVGIQMGTIDIPDQFSKILLRHRFYAIPAFDHGAPLSFGAGWRIDLDTAHIWQDAQTPGYSGGIRFLSHRFGGTAVVFLGNMAYNSTTELGTVLMDAAHIGIFEQVGRDALVTLDTFFTILTALGILHAISFVRLIIRTIKRLKDGEVIKPVFTSRAKLRILDVIINIIVLAVFYLGTAAMFENSFAHAAAHSPLSLTTGGIALWVMAVYTGFRFLVLAFINPR
ncbi:MAG: beta-lactamase family protein [Defluviitaleaceae bacterium]|nr:beta-lactamase family protein [Defluviitaleaceae bacterium]